MEYQLLLVYQTQRGWLKELMLGLITLVHDHTFSCTIIYNKEWIWESLQPQGEAPVKQSFFIQIGSGLN